MAKKIKIKRITHLSENNSTKINNIKKDKFHSSDKLLFEKLYHFLLAHTLKKRSIDDEEDLIPATDTKKEFIKFFSINELFYIENIPVDSNTLNCLNENENFLFPFLIKEFDLLKGIYKHDYVIYKIVDVEYEEYDKLNEFLKEEKLFKNHICSLRKPFINGFYVDKNTEMELIKNEQNPALTDLDIFTR